LQQAVEVVRVLVEQTGLGSIVRSPILWSLATSRAAGEATLASMRRASASSSALIMRMA
jgi:hypothetical protein